MFCSSSLKDDRSVMVRSKRTVKTIQPPYRYYMELRSTTRRSPPCTHVDTHGYVNSHGDCTTGQPNGVARVKAEGEVSSPVLIRNECSKYARIRYLVYCISGMCIFSLCVIITSLVFPYPMHASCIVKWKFGDPCIHIMQKFRSQMINWSSCMNCGKHGSRCLYTLKEPTLDESNIIRAIHLGPNLRTMESIKIVFGEINKTCVATGESISKEWFKIFDYGINYCNLHNLVTGIGFDKNSKFLELTTNAVCTQYNMAVCD